MVNSLSEVDIYFNSFDDIDEVFHIAAVNGDITTVTHFLSKGAQIHNNIAAFWGACQNGHLKVVQHLVQYHPTLVNLDTYGVRLAAYNNHIEIVKFLVFEGVSTEGLLVDSCDHFEIVKFIVTQAVLSQSDKNKAIWWVAQTGNLHLLQYFVTQGMDVTAGENNALHVACRSGHLEMVKYLVHQGSDVRSRDDLALCYAAHYNHLEIVKYLVSLGSSVTSMNNYAIRWAAECGHLDVVKYLVSVGAHIRCDKCKCALPVSRHIDIIKYLVSQGADMRANGDYAIRWASWFQYFEVVRYLIQTGVPESLVENDRCKRYLAFCKKIEDKKRIRAQKHIYYWVQQYVLSKPEVVLRMGERSFESFVNENNLFVTRS